MALGNALVGIGKEKQTAVVAFFCIIINVGLNVALIPSYGLIVSAFATLAAESVLFIMYIYLFRRSLGALPMHHYVLKPILASIPMVIVAVVLKGDVFAIGLIAAGVYFITFFLIGGLDPSEEQFVRDRVKTLVSKNR